MDRELLHKTWQIAEETLRPRAVAADGDHGVDTVRANVRLLADAGFFGLGVPRACGGLEVDEVTRHEYAEILAGACGVTAFTQQQLQTGVKFITEAANDAPKSDLLPVLAAGQRLCGVAISQLRRSGPPSVRAARVTGGYRVSGVIPWLTGWSLLDDFVLGAALDDGSHLFAYVEQARQNPALTAGAPLSLVVMEASDTVEVTVRDLFVPDARVLGVRPGDELQHTDDKMLTAHAALPLGCARASARFLRELAEQPGREPVRQAALALTFETDQCRREALTWNCDCVGHPEYKTYALRARATAIVLALRGAHAAVAAAGGRAHLRTALPQRLLREAQFYTTAVQTPEVQASTLDHLFSPLFGL